jgi:hypothetical protein
MTHGSVVRHPAIVSVQQPSREEDRGVALVAATSKGAVPEVVKARAFHVVGKDGTALAKLEDTYGLSQHGLATTTTLDGKGQEPVSLGARTDGPGAVFTFDPRSIEARGVYTTQP